MSAPKIVLDFEDGWPSHEEIKAAFVNKRAADKILTCALTKSELEPHLEIEEVVIHKQAS